MKPSEVKAKLQQISSVIDRLDESVSILAVSTSFSSASIQIAEDSPLPYGDIRRHWSGQYEHQTVDINGISVVRVV
jgi:hypothetical protein